MMIGIIIAKSNIKKTLLINDMKGCRIPNFQLVLKVLNTKKVGFDQ